MRGIHEIYAGFMGYARDLQDTRGIYRIRAGFMGYVRDLRDMRGIYGIIGRRLRTEAFVDKEEWNVEGYSHIMQGCA